MYQPLTALLQSHTHTSTDVRRPRWRAAGNGGVGMGGRGRGGDGKETQRRMISNKTAIEGSCEGEKIREGRGRIQ